MRYAWQKIKIFKNASKKKFSIKDNKIKENENIKV